MFWATAARKNCSRTNLSLRRRKRRKPIWFFSSANKASTFFLCRCALANSGVLTNSRARCRAGSFWWMIRPRKAALVHCGRSEHGPTLFACPDVVEGSIAINSSTVVEELASGTDVAIVFRFVGKTLGAKEWAPLSVDTVTGPHVGSDAPIG